MTATPAWATKLVDTVCRSYGYSLKRPTLVWRQSKTKSYTSGFTYDRGNRVVVTAGTDPVQHKVVLLHEMAHWLAGPGVRHSPAFWDIAYDLYSTHGVYRAALGIETGSLPAARRRALKGKAA